LLRIFFDPLSQRGGAGFAPPLPLFHLKQKRPVLHSSIIASAFPEPIKPFSHREAGFQPPGSAFAFPSARWKAVFQKTIEKASGKA